MGIVETKKALMDLTDSECTWQTNHFTSGQMQTLARSHDALLKLCKVIQKEDVYYQGDLDAVIAEAEGEK